MAKKKSNPTVVNNIKSVNMEIDYDKLAEAVVKAQEKAAKIEETEELEKVKVTFFETIKAMYMILCGKRKTKGLTNDIFVMLTSLLFKIVGWIGVIVSPIVIGFCFYFAVRMNWTPDAFWNNLMTEIAYIIIASYSGLAFMFSVMLIGASREIQREKDKNYIIAIFSGVVSFAALVVALVALVKGVA